MSKLTKSEAKLHGQACDLLAKDTLDSSEKEFVLSHWREDAEHVNSLSGAFFTPSTLAWDLSIYAPSNGTLIDLCAGIGQLAYRCVDQYERDRGRGHSKIVCVEINPAYVEVGKKILPDAVWICADIFTAGIDEILALNSGHPFDFAISNPPFGRSKDMPLAGVTTDLNVLAIAAKLARCGAFILPQESCPFKYSGNTYYEPRPSSTFDKFYAETGVELTCSSSDCVVFKDDWRGVSPNVEIALFDLDEQIVSLEEWASTRRTSGVNESLDLSIFGQ